MQNTHQYFVNGRLVYVPEDELSDFKENCADNGFDYEEGEVFRATNGANEVQEFTVPKSQIEAFKASAAENGGRADPMTMLTMDDGNRITLRDEDVRQFVQARRQGMPMSRGLLKNTGIPDWYGKGVDDREALADALGGMFFPEDTATATDNALPRKENFRDVLARGGNVIAETAAPAIAAAKGFGEGLVRSVTDPAALYAETYGEDSPIANALLGSQDFANTAVRGGMDVAAKALGGRDSVAGRAIREAESALPTDQASVETGSGIGNAVVGFANDFSKNTLSTIMKYAAPGVAAVDIAGSVVDNYYDGYERAIANGASQDKANALASAAAGIGAAEGIWLAQSAAGGQTANAVKAGLKRILGMGGKMGVTAGARDVVEQGIEGADNLNLVRTGKEALKSAAEGALFEATSMGVHGLAGANERRMDLEARRTAQERAAEAEKENARVDARTRYEANLSEEARADVERNVNEMVKTGVVPSYRQADEVAKLAEAKLTRETGESAEAVQQAVMEAAQEVNERLQAPSRIESPTLERRQTEARMRENERWAKRSDELAAEYEAEQAKPAERAPNDAEAVAATQAEERSARQADLEAAFADWTDADAKVADAVKTQKRGGAVKNVEAMKRGAEEAKQRTLTRLQKMETADLEDNIGVLEAIENPPKKIQNQLQVMKDELARRANGVEGVKFGEESAKADAETQKLTDEVSENDGEVAKSDSVRKIGEAYKVTSDRIKASDDPFDYHRYGTVYAERQPVTIDGKDVAYVEHCVDGRLRELAGESSDVNEYVLFVNGGEIGSHRKIEKIVGVRPEYNEGRGSVLAFKTEKELLDAYDKLNKISPKAFDTKAEWKDSHETESGVEPVTIKRKFYDDARIDSKGKTSYDIDKGIGIIRKLTDSEIDDIGWYFRMGDKTKGEASPFRQAYEQVLSERSAPKPDGNGSVEKSADPKAGGRAQKATDAAFRAWAVDRDGKPIEFATKADEAQSRETFDMLVKMGKVDAQTGKAVETKRIEAQEPIATELAKVSQTDETFREKQKRRFDELNNDPKGFDSNGKETAFQKTIDAYSKVQSPAPTEAKSIEAASRSSGEAIQYASELAPKKGFESVNSPFKRNPLPKSADPKAGGRSAKAPANQTTNPDAAVTSAQKLLKERFYADEKTLSRQLAALPAQAPADLRAAYETALAEAKKRDMRPNDVMSDASVGGKCRGAVQQISDTSMSTKLADPDFTDWAAKRGVTPTDGARRDYDAQQIDALGKHVTKNWLKGVTFRRSENAAEVPTNARQLYSRDGNVVGWYDSAKKEVVTLPGSDAGTIGHELGWHATYDHAKERAAAGDRALLDKLDQYANDAKRIIVDPATGRTLEQEITTRYGRNGITDPAVLLDEIGAARYTMQNVAKIKDAAARRQAAKWYGRAWNAVADTYKAILTKMGWNKARLDGINAMTPENVVNLLADEMLRGRNLGKATPATQIDMNKGEGIVQWHDRKLKDYLRPLEELEKEAGKTVSASAHTKLRLMPGRVQAAINEAESFANDIKNQCKNAGIKISELNEFMYARAASERNAKILARNGRLDGSAMSHADIQRVLTAYNNSPKSAALTRIADDVLAFQNRGFEKRVRSGLIDAQTAIDLMAEEPHHVPMKSRFNADGEHIGFDRDSVFGRPEFHEAKGRTNLGDGPLEWILQEYVDAKTRSAANDARQALLTTVLAHPEVGTVRKLRDGERSGEISRKGMQGNANVLTVKSNGQTYVIELNGTRGEKIAAAVTGRNIFRPPESLQKIARWWSSAATEWSPTFAGRNVIADTLDVFAVNTAEHGIVGGFVKNAKHVYNAVSMISAIRDYVKTGKTNNAVLREAIDAGVLMGGGVRGQAFDVNENALKTLKDDFTKGKSRVRAVGKTLFGWVNTINQTAELMNRMADYKIQRDMGKSKNEAALHAREITVDFNEKGEITPATNLAYMFSNSSLGATMRLNKALFTGKNGVQLAVGMFALGLIEGAAEAMNNGDDEDGKNMNEYTRANSFYFRNGKDVYRIPLHASPISIIKYAGNCAARKMLGNLGTDKAANQIADEMIGIITQFAGIGDVGDNKLSGVFPSIIQPIVQAVINRDYADRPIEKTSFNETKPKSDNGRDSTPELYKNIAKSINAFGGGNEAKKGKISGINTDYSPEMYKHFTEAIGKNAMRDVMNSYEVANLALNLVTGRKSVAEMYEETDRRNLPVVRDYYRTTGGNDNRYFEAIRAFKESSDEFKERRDEMDSDARKTFVQANPWLRNTDVARKIMKRIDDLRHYEKSEMKNGRSYRKLKIKLPKEKIEKFKEERMRLQAKFIELMDR